MNDLKERLKEIDTTGPEWLRRDARRQVIIEAAVDAAEKIILEHTDGSKEETDYLTSMVADAYHQKLMRIPGSAMMKADFGRKD